MTDQLERAKYTRKRNRIRRGDALSALYVPELPQTEAGPPRRPARHEGHPHGLQGTGNDLHRHPMPDEGATKKDFDSPVTQGHAEVLNENLAVLAQEMPETERSETQIYKELTDAGVRPMFAAMAAHQEIAAIVLAAGGTLGEAANRAGVTEATVSRYWSNDSFRRRVQELRSVVLDSINGRIVGELDRRTKGPNLRRMEIMDVLRVYDRTNPKQGAAGRSVTVAGNLNVTQLNYAGIEAEIERPDAAEESADFVVLGADGAPVAEGSS